MGGRRVGGIFFQTQAQALARRGVAVTVVAPTPGRSVAAPAGATPMAAARVGAARPCVMGGVRVLRPRYPNVPGEPSWARPDRFIAAAAWRLGANCGGARHVIHGHYAVTGLAAWRLARRAALPFFLTFHGERHEHLAR